MKSKSVLRVLTLLATLVCSMSALIYVSHAEFGPTTDLQIFYYANDTALYTSLKTGEIDLSFWEVTPLQYADAIIDRNILLAPVPRFDYRAFSLNLNETINDFSGVKNPLTIIEFRKAIHRLSNRDYYVNTICQGFATKVSVAVSAPSSGWFNQSVVDFVEGRAPGRYPYPYDSLTYNPAAAAALLDAGGFTDTGDADSIRNYPENWPGRPGRPNLDPIKFVIRSDDLLRKAAGEHLATQMENVGIPVNRLLLSSSAASPIVMTARNYHLYTAGWSVGRFPTYLYSWFHSSRWFPGGSNYHLSKTPLYSDIDAAVEKVLYPPSYDAAMDAAMQAQYMTTEKYTVIVSLWSAKAFYPYRNSLLGVTNMLSVGPENDYTYLKALKIGGGPFKVGLKSPPFEVNQIYSRWLWDAQTMNPFMAGFLSTPAYNIMRDQPWLLQDWTSPPGTWFDGPIEKSKMTYWFRDDPNDGLGDADGEWIEPITGNVLDDFSSQWIDRGGYEFNVWYYASEPGGWIYTNYRDVEKIRTDPANKRVDVYFGVKSYWSLYWATGRFIYSPVWKQSPLATLETRVFVEGVNATTPGNLNLPYLTVGAPVEIVEIKEDTTPPTTTIFLQKSNYTHNNDYEIVSGRIRIYKDIPSTRKITVTYWARGDPAGYAPGGLYYSGTGVGKVWIGAGLYYVTEHFSGAGGWTAYRKNPHFFLQTPPKGELDFWWFWQGTTPRGGYYAVTGADLVVSTVALDGHGYATPTLNWEPGTDLTWPGGTELRGKITVHDNTIVAKDYGEAFGSPP